MLSYLIVIRPKKLENRLQTDKTRGTTAVDPRHLKVKEQDVSLTKTTASLSTLK